MDSKINESLSALTDGEANELELQRLLGQTDNAEFRSAWSRYNNTQASLQGHSIAMADFDISQQVRDAIAQESSSSVSGSSVKKLMKPFASLAVAASVAAVTIVGGQQLAAIDSSENQQYAASYPVGVVNTLGAVPVQASYGTQALPQQPSVRVLYRELARERMQQYMQEHAEQAALNSPEGMVPFARVPTIQQQ